MQLPESQRKVLEHIRSIYALRSAMAIHGWDQETKMPVGGGSSRAFVMAELAGHLHRAMTEPSWLKQLEDGVASAAPDSDLHACFSAVLRDCKRKAKLSLSLDKALVQGASLAQQAWVEARNQGDAKPFLPLFEQLVHLKRQEAECYATPGQSFYEALMQTYEPGLTLSQIEPVFDTLEAGILEIIELMRNQGRLLQPPPFPAKFPQAVQESYLKELLHRMGFDMARGRLDRSAHPFTESLHRNDVRLTVRYDESNLLDSYFSLLHEGGHGLYEQGFKEDWNFTAMAEAVSLGVHESQSRFWENCIGRSRDYWEGEYPLLQQYFPDALASVSLDAFMLRVQAVHPSMIRVQADEVTYNLHIILRFRLEKMVLEGSLNVSDLESAWNSEMQKWFWMPSGHMNEGYLQDVHWAAGLFGYFPTYTLGNLWAAQIHQRIQEQYPRYKTMIREGHFGPILEWLQTNIHQSSRKHTPLDLMRKATGMDLNPQVFLQYLRSRYLDI